MVFDVIVGAESETSDFVNVISSGTDDEDGNIQLFPQPAADSLCFRRCKWDFSFGEENKILLWGQEGNQPPAGEIFRMFQIAVKKIWQEFSAACVHLDIFSRYR